MRESRTYGSVRGGYRKVPVYSIDMYAVTLCRVINGVRKINVTVQNWQILHSRLVS